MHLKYLLILIFIFILKIRNLYIFTWLMVFQVQWNSQKRNELIKVEYFHYLSNCFFKLDDFCFCYPFLLIVSYCNGKIKELEALHVHSFVNVLLYFAFATLLSLWDFRFFNKWTGSTSWPQKGDCERPSLINSFVGLQQSHKDIV